MIRQIVMPNSYKHQALKLAHSMLPAGHVGVQVTLARCQKFSYWYGMKKDVENYCKACLYNRFRRSGGRPNTTKKLSGYTNAFLNVYT